MRQIRNLSCRIKHCLVNHRVILIIVMNGKQTKLQVFLFLFSVIELSASWLEERWIRLLNISDILTCLFGDSRLIIDILQIWDLRHHFRTALLFSNDSYDSDQFSAINQTPTRPSININWKKIETNLINTWGKFRHFFEKAVLCRRNILIRMAYMANLKNKELINFLDAIRGLRGG